MFPSVTEKMVDPFAVEAAANYPYDVPNVHVDFQQQEIGIDVGYWRSVSHALNCFVAESFMDELAVSREEELATSSARRCSRNSRASSGCSTSSSRSRASDTPPSGHYHGLAVMEGYGTYMAQVAEISLEGRQGQGASHLLRRGLRPAGEPRHGGRADRKLDHLRAVGADVGRDQHPERPRAADQFRQLPGRAHERCAAHRFLRRSTAPRRPAASASRPLHWWLRPSVMRFTRPPGVDFGHSRCRATRLVRRCATSTPPKGASHIWSECKR